MQDKNEKHKPISFRIHQPLGHDEDPSHTFCDPTQAQATTATLFFRQREIYSLLKKRIAPDWMNAHPHAPLCIWSAGCSSGQEAWGLAMVAADCYRAQKKYENFKVFGTDINRDRINEARAGVYPPNLRDEAFRPVLLHHARIHDDLATIKTELRPHVSFGVFDIRKCPNNHRFAYIVCNHVLQYYTHELQKQIVSNFLSVLEPGGLMYLEGLTPSIAGELPIKKFSSVKNVFERTDG